MDYDTLWANILTTNPYTTLSVTKTSTPAQTEQACTHLSRFCNGDKHVIALLERARDILLDPIRRQICEEGSQRKAKKKAGSEARIAAGPFEGDALIGLLDDGVKGGISPARNAASPARSASSLSCSDDELAEPSLLA